MRTVAPLHLLILPLLLLSSGPLAGQSSFHEPQYHRDDPALPDWVKLMYAADPNVFQVDSAFTAYHAGRLFVKNEYTQYYKRWRRWAEPFVRADGTIRVPGPLEQERRQQEMLARKNAPAKRQAGSGWKFIGPKSTASEGPDNTPITWQTNIYCLDQSRSNPDILYAGGETGGVFKSTDKGKHWSQVSGSFLHGSIRPVKIRPDNANVALAGTSGKIVRTTDGGLNWTTVYMEADLWSHDMAIDPSDPSTMLAATNKGLLRSTDGGATWMKILPGECWSVAIHPTTPSIMYVVEDSANSCVFRISSDHGATFPGRGEGWWTPAANQSVYGVRITVTTASPDRVYALIGAEASNPDDLRYYAGVFVSTDAGHSWSNTNPANRVGVPYSIPDHTNLSANDGTTGFSQGFYDFAIVANPRNASELVAGGTSWWRSSDAGATWNPLGGYVGGLPWAHPDMQWLHASGNDLWICSDGGINYSTDFAQTHEPRMEGISGSDFWGFDTGWNEDVFVGGRYHNGNTAFVEGYPDGKFLRMGGGEAATGYVNPGEDRRVYFSDIGGRILPKTIEGSSIGFSTGMWPNESYWYAEFSGMAFDPACSGTIYIGHGNGLWKSVDGGASYTLLHSFVFGGDSTAWIFHIEISRANRNVIYVSQQSNVLWDGMIWRTTDGGATWSAAAPLPAQYYERRVLTMAASGTNEKELWVALRSGPENGKIFKTTDGGDTWINLTTPAISQVWISHIVHQLGTDGGIYLGTSGGGIFYRNNTMSDWASCVDGLPLSLGARKLKPFYRAGKIRVGSDMGIWEADLFEPSKPLAQISADQLRSTCVRDTFQFSDRSALRHAAGTSWKWSFPGASYVSSATVYNPRVAYPAPGVYGVSLTVADPQGSSTQIIPDLIRVEASECAPDTIPGFAVSLGGNADPGRIEIPPLGIRTNRLTFTAWVKPDGPQPSFCSIVSGNGMELNIDGGNELKYYWPPNGLWWIGSGLTVDSGKWSHVAFVVTPDSLTLYVNGRGWTVKHANDSVLFANPLLLGNYNYWGDRHYKGLIDEVCLYDRPLSTDEIREQMHLTKNGAGFPPDPNLIAYYQFNELSSSGYDRVMTHHAALVGSAKRLRSTGPFGGGSSARLHLSGGTGTAFGATGVTIAYGSVSGIPDGDVVVTRINQLPDEKPAPKPGGSAYYVLEQYGSAGTFAPPAGISISGYGSISAGESGQPDLFSLYRRDPNADGNVWIGTGTRALAAVQSGGGSLSFGSPANVTASSQLYVLRDGTPTLDVRAEKSLPENVEIFPTVIAAGASFTLRLPAEEDATMYLYNSVGQLLLQRKFHTVEQIGTAGLRPGAYILWVRTRTKLTSGRIIVR